MEYLSTFLKFVIKSFDTKFIFLISIILIINVIYLFLYFRFEIRYKNKKLIRKNPIKKLIIRIKSKIYGINPEIFEKIDKKTAS